MDMGKRIKDVIEFGELCRDIKKITEILDMPHSQDKVIQMLEALEEQKRNDFHKLIEQFLLMSLNEKLITYKSLVD